uniref:Uncharacterized protein n=1 Tax=Oryza rufipogon TaxID=4529 RepID=A0A0E0RH00_ORYRU
MEWCGRGEERVSVTARRRRAVARGWEKMRGAAAPAAADATLDSVEGREEGEGCETMDLHPTLSALHSLLTNGPHLSFSSPFLLPPPLSKTLSRRAAPPPLPPSLATLGGRLGGNGALLEAELRRGFKTLAVTPPDPSTVVYKVRLNRSAQLNALSLDAFAEIPRAMALLDRILAAHAVVLSPAGPHCPGNPAMAPSSPGGGDPAPAAGGGRRGLQVVLTAIERCRKLVVVAVHGGGVEVMASCAVLEKSRRRWGWNCVRQSSPQMIKHPWLIASTQFWQASGEQPPSHCGAHAVATVSVYSHEWAHVSSQLPAEHLRRRRRDGGGGEDNQHDAGHGGDGDGSRRRGYAGGHLLQDG